MNFLKIIDLDVDQDLSYLFYAYMIVLEKSTAHLKNQFTLTMMQQMNRIRNAANAHYLLYKARNTMISKIDQIESRFKLDWDLYENGQPNKNFKDMFHV